MLFEPPNAGEMTEQEFRDYIRSVVARRNPDYADTALASALEDTDYRNTYVSELPGRGGRYSYNPDYLREREIAQNMHGGRAYDVLSRPNGLVSSEESLYHELIHRNQMMNALRDPEARAQIAAILAEYGIIAPDEPYFDGGTVSGYADEFFPDIAGGGMVRHIERYDFENRHLTDAQRARIAQDDAEVRRRINQIYADVYRRQSGSPYRAQQQNYSWYTQQSNPAPAPAQQTSGRRAEVSRAYVPEGENYSYYTSRRQPTQASVSRPTYSRNRRRAEPAPSPSYSGLTPVPSREERVRSRYNRRRNTRRVRPTRNPQR